MVDVSPDLVKSHDRFKAKYQLSLPLGSGESKTMLEAYGEWGEKSIYGRKSMGV